MWVRKRIDIAWRDLAFGVAQSCLPADRRAIGRRVESRWSEAGDSLACLSVRSGFDLLLTALRWPPGSEVLMSALTIPHMVDVVEHHGLVPVPVDLDAGSLAPSVEAMRLAITPATRAVVVAHLFGGRTALEPIVALAKSHRLLVIEDCAQAFAGHRYRGCPGADVSMFSFGPIKTATALGGAVLCVRDRILLGQMRDRQAGYPVQSRWLYLRRLAKYSVLKALSTRVAFSALVRTCRAVGCPYDRLVNGSARSFRGPGFFDRIRRQPSAPLLALLERRLRAFDQGRLAGHAAKGRSLLSLLQGRVPCPGSGALRHTYWVFAVLVDDPPRVIAALRQAGFDATQGESLSVVPPPASRPELEPKVARAILSQVVFLPLYPEMSARTVRDMAEVLLKTCALAPGRATGDRHPIRLGRRRRKATECLSGGFCPDRSEESERRTRDSSARLP